MSQKKSLKLMGRKLGMTQLFDENGFAVACTVIQVEPNVITQIKTKEKDGYNAVQLGFDAITAKDERTVAKRTTKPRRGHFAKANVTPRRFLRESRVESVDNYEVGQEIGVSHFNEIKHVDIFGQSIGKGFQGVMKLHGFGGGPGAHGSGFHRAAGSTQGRAGPGRCFPNGKRASHMGDKQITVQNQKVIKIDENENLIIVKGSIPGANNSVITITEAVKK